MANDYFNFLSGLRLPRRQIAKAESVNAVFEAIEAAFALLPSIGAIATGTANYGVATGIANTYTVTISGVAAYVEGQSFLVKIPVTSTGPSTLNVNALGATTMKRSDGGALGDSDLVAGGIYQMTYDGSALRVTSALALINGLAAIASNIAFSPPAGMVSTDVQAAISELKTALGAISTTGDSVTVSAGGMILAGTLNAALQRISDAISDDPNFAATVTTALAGKQPLDATLTALSGLTTSGNQMPYSTGADAFAMTALTAFARTLLDDADAAAMRATLGIVSGSLLNAQFITASGTVTKTAGATKWLAFVQGGGGGGPSAAKAGGHAGALCIGLIDVSAVTGYSATIGSGGASNNAGGGSSISTLTANGGPVGDSSAASTATGGVANIPSKPGSFALVDSSAPTYAVNGGDSFFGSGGRVYDTGGSAIDPAGYGSGGRRNGSGRPGCILILEFA